MRQDDEEEIIVGSPPTKATTSPAGIRMETLSRALLDCLEGKEKETFLNSTSSPPRPFSHWPAAEPRLEIPRGSRGSMALFRSISALIRF